MDRKEVRISLDVGSRSIKAAAFDTRGNILRMRHFPVRGQLCLCLNDVLLTLDSEFKEEESILCAVTGANAVYYEDLLGIQAINGIQSTYLGVRRMSPEAGAILEIGGEHAKFIRLSSGGDGHKDLKDFFMNSVCSAGTGSFLEQEAHRLGLTIDEFSRLATQPSQHAPVAGRCAVFAKTDVVHLHQNGVPLSDIANSLCRAITQNVCNELILSRKFDIPLVFVGGVAANIGIHKALRDILKLDEYSLIVPENYLFLGALGAFLVSKQSNGKSECSLDEAIVRLKKGLERSTKKKTALQPLNNNKPDSSIEKNENKGTGITPVLGDLTIGIDIGSTSTNTVCVTSDGEIAASITLPTQGQALTSVFKGLTQLREKIGSFKPKAVGVTGSGRKLVAKIIGADAVLNEITAHYVGGSHFLESVDTIFDIGGQDSKYIRIENGSVSHFAMNKVCSAGTGSFLEEMSVLLGLRIKDEFAEKANRSLNPVDLGERCTVFMSTDLMRKLQEGEKIEDLAAGLSYAVVKNYLSRVVGRNRVGKNISFQGGVASNPAIVSALENVLQKPIHVHECHEFAGALGVALFSLRKRAGESMFRGFDRLGLQSLEMQTFACKECANTCRIISFKDTSGERFYSGGLCERYEEKTTVLEKTGKEDIDPFEEREKLLTKHIHQAVRERKKDCIGIPRALLFYDLIPFWATFFNQLGIDYKFSEPTTRETIQRGVSHCPSNPCLPLKTAYGHCHELLDAGIQRIFIPSVSNMSFLTTQERMNHICPASQAWPFTAKSLFPDRAEFLTPTIRYAMPHLLKQDIIRFGKSLGKGKREVLSVFEKAMDAQSEFFESITHVGRNLLSQDHKHEMFALILSRPYTVCDPQVRWRLGKIFDELNISAIPMDMIDGIPRSSKELDKMYWYYGKRFLQTVEALSNFPNMAVIHLSNFGCGADSFILHFLRERLKGVPFLELEIDEHNEFTGIGTRLEAFVLSLDKKSLKKEQTVQPKIKYANNNLKQRKLLLPQMSDYAFAFQASFKSFGVEAEVLPLPDAESISCGKDIVAGGECLPCPFLIGDILKYLNHHQNEQNPPAFFMISGDGPCRLGQYPYLQRLVLDEKGYEDVFIFDASQDQEFYDRLGILPARFKRKTWQGVVATDLLFRKMRECRPYVDGKISFDEIYYKEIQKLCGCIENGDKLSEQLGRSFQRLDSLKNTSSEYKPIIAVLGENYVRCNSIANGKIAELLEDMGAEVWFPSLFEWVYYGNWTARLHCLYEKQYKKFFSLFLIDAIQHWDEFKLRRAIKGQMQNLKEPSMMKNFERSSDYVPRTFEGETMIEIARTIDFYDKGASGVIHAVPFSCIMGTIVETLSEKLSEDLGGFPIMTLQYDGLDYKSQANKLEGFMTRAQMWNNKQRKNEHPSFG